MSADAIPPQNVELRNQLEAFAQRCAYAEATVEPAGAPDTGKAADKPTEKTTPRASPKKVTSVYSVQVAAYDSKEAARVLSESLIARGLDARVDGTTRPYRVRIGRFATRAEAVKLAQKLKAEGQGGFVTLVRP